MYGIPKPASRSWQFQFAMRRMLRSRVFCILAAAVLFAIALINVIRVANVLMSRGGDGGVYLDDSKQLRNPLATDFSAADASPEASQKLVRELLRIKKSVKKELADLESKRSLRLKELNTYADELTRTKVALSKSISDVQQMQFAIISLKSHQEEIEKRNIPLLRPPLLAVDSGSDKMVSEGTIPPQHLRQDCSVHTCFNYRHCGLTSPAYVSFTSNASRQAEVKILKTAVKYSPFTVRTTSQSCIRIEFSVNECEKIREFNCILIDSHGTQNIPSSFHGIVASASASRQLHRSGFDVVMPAPAMYSSDDVWSHLQPLFPARRTYLVSFMGLPPAGKSDIDREVVLSLSGLRSGGKHQDQVSIQFTCNVTKPSKLFSDWELCGPRKLRLDLLKKSTFALIIAAPSFSKQVSSARLQLRIYESLLAGAIPVIVGDALLPFEELIEWNRAVIRLPKQRAPELHFLLRTIPDADLIEMRRRGRLVMETNLGTTERQWGTLLALIGRRIGLAQPSVNDYPSTSAFEPNDFKPETYEVENQFADIDDYLGPADPPRDSVAYQSNFSSLWTDRKVGQDADPFHRYPFTPWSPVLPSEGQFKQSMFGFRPIDHGEGQAGVEFSKAMGGNHPYEQFTVVLLTYKRETVLMSTLATFKGLPYLHSVIVVWNSPAPPSTSLKWPKLQVPIHVVRGIGNSLNNRFLPFDLIKTEAILSVDDDVQLRQDEIVFGFRVWREQRHKLVGFPARYHQWSKNSQSWRYNSNHTCEYSMILTGAAFFHKYYSYLYSNMMPKVIRSYVDRVMNCEDLAMNFLISHITREPPVKVTSRWTFRCQLCTDSLYLDRSHFDERHACINFLTDVYGYNPLLYSQFRLDSVLFKTRIPSDKRKCFKYV